MNMGDSFKEILVKRQPQGRDTVVRIALWALTVLLFAAGIFAVPLLLAAGVGVAALTVYLSQNMNVEYEYTYVNGDFDIDKIMNKTRRKRCISLDHDKLQMCARTGSSEARAAAGNLAVEDFTSGDEHKPSWTLIYSMEKGKYAARMELDEDVINDLWRRGPRTVVRN